MIRNLLPIFLIVLCQQLYAGGPGALFTENKGQWPDQVLYRALIPGGSLYVERGGFTYVAVSGRHHHHGGEQHDEEPKGHAWKVHFRDGGAKAHLGSGPQQHYENHFIGNDTGKWAGGCRVFREVLLQEVWPGVDIRISGSNGLKYDLLVKAGHDPSAIVLEYEGADRLQLWDGDLHVSTTLGTVVEKAPVVTDLNGRPVACGYDLRGNELRFAFQGNTVVSGGLIIDPEVSFSSFSGSDANNFGFTATYDDDGHLYGGGIVFQSGYPTTTGAFDPSFNGGTIDVGVSKWSPDGSALVWSTYIGGSGNEAPHSLVVNEQDELFILGTTGSADMPVTPGCYDASYNGGPFADLGGSYGFTMENGSDIFIVRLNSAGSALLGATYFGGSALDGLNLASGLYHNYGDPFRGEIMLNEAGEPMVSTTTRSTDLPTTPGAPQTSYGGGQSDAFFFRMDPSLSNLLWATYHGGSGNDSGYGIQTSSTGQIYCTGGTSSSNMPTAGQPMDGSFGGNVDGYIARYPPNGGNLLSCTFIGTADYDQCFFVQLDVEDDVYVVGQTHGNYPVTPGKYSVSGSSQFIHKISGDLTASIWSTRIGNGDIGQDLSPSAFLVSDCFQIYFSGWAGSTNNSINSNNSTTTGSPVTSDAFQSTTDGNDFYLMVLEPDAEGLNYATFFGGGTSPEHVDGGTSRFDKNGKVYQAVCAGCQGQSDFPTTPGAWSNTNNSFGCNLAVMKFDLSTVIAVISIEGPDVVCAPAEVQFQSVSSGGDTYSWHFGDGGTSSEQAPQHTFTEPGVYTVSLTVTDSYGCVLGDSTTIEITVMGDVIASIGPVPPICPGGEAQLVAMPADLEYAWSPATGLSATNIQDPVASPGGPMTYQVIVSGDCGVDTATVDITYADPQGSAMPDVAVCLGESVMLEATGGATFSWSPTGTLSDPTSPTPIATPTDTTMYVVEMVTDDGCDITDSVQVNVVDGPPDQVLEDLAVCAGNSVQLVGPVADQYQWTPAEGLTETTVRSPIVTPPFSNTYVLLSTNVCGSTLDSAHVSVVEVMPLAWPDTIVCPGRSVQLHAAGGTTYQWEPSTWLNDAASAAPVCQPSSDVTYTVTVGNDMGCSAQAELTVLVHPLPFVNAGEDVIADYGDRVILQGSGEGEPVWEPFSMVEPYDGFITTTSPEESTLYTLTITDVHGCRNSDQVWVILHGSLFLPNTFTPNGDGVNDVFGAWGKDIAEFQLLVFDRWGEMIYEADRLDARWDGTRGGVDCPIDTYVWRVDVVEKAGTQRTLFGHVNLVR